MSNNKKELISLDKIHIPRWNELPNVDLYLDQVVTFINSSLSEILSFNTNADKDENQILTKTMINNYVKNNLIEAPIKKKYSKIQCAKIFAICILKQVFSMNEIYKLIEIALKHSDVEHAYDSFCNHFEKALSCAYNKEDFLDEDTTQNDNKYLLKSVLLSCCYKIYVQNVI
jgi:hypothetical protein